MTDEPAKGTTEVAEPTPAELSYARRIAEARATIPHDYAETEADPAGGIRTAAVVVACAAALGEFPRVNGAYRDGRFEVYERINIAVGTPSGDSLVYPVVRDADRRDEAQVAEEIRRLDDLVRAGAITNPDLAGATFSLFDPSVHGISRYQATVNRRQAAILTVGTGSLGLSFDARILQGIVAVRFLARVRDLL